MAIALGSASILVTPGAHMSSVAKHRLKAGFDYSITSEWKIGADLVYTAGAWIRGDEINAFGTLAPCDGQFAQLLSADQEFPDLWTDRQCRRHARA